MVCSELATNTESQERPRHLNIQCGSLDPGKVSGLSQ